MEKLADIKKELMVSPYKIIHQMTDVSESTINAMFQGARNINTPTGAKVLKAAKQIIQSHKALIHGKAPMKKKERKVMPGQAPLL